MMQSGYEMIKPEVKAKQMEYFRERILPFYREQALLIEYRDNKKRIEKKGGVDVPRGLQ